MKNFYFSKREAISFGWKKMRENMGFLGLVLLFTFLVSSGSTFFERYLNDMSLLRNLYGMVFAVLTTIIQMGFLKIILKIHDEQEAEFSDLFSSFHLFFKYFIASILYGIVVAFGLVLLIVPGIILAIKYVFYDYLIIDKELGPLEALRESSRITGGVKWQLFIFMLLVFLINFAGILFFGVGLLLTIPATTIATAYVYRRLLARVEETQPTELSEQSGF
jgi:uncharacterized membrane protein